MSKILEVFSDLSERLNYNLPDFPLYVRKGALRQFYRYTAECHWHSDLEFIYVLDGSMEYFVNGQTAQIYKENGIFVNSKRLHYGFSTNQTDCSFIVVAIHPTLLGEANYPVKVYLQEKFGLTTVDFILLNAQIPWQREALLSLPQMYAEMCRNTPSPLRLLAQATSLCAGICDHIQQDASQLPGDQSWITFWKMSEFIHRHYDVKISLNDIAATGPVSRSRCCKLFGKNIGQSPNAYLNGYRIMKSCEMLRETNRSICEIAIACGFQTASYFSYAFRKEMGMVPQDYRKQCKGLPLAP
jgi:AraC family transcriptional regulator, melibiose operon regulatory protein